MQRELGAELLTVEAYEGFGEVVAPRLDVAPVAANQGTADRFNRLVELVDHRPQTARPNLCLYRCRPSAQNPFPVRLLERHPFSTQVFLPMAGLGCDGIGGRTRYLVVVCRGEEAPDLDTLRAFVVEGGEGISYQPGIWHHPMIALDHSTTFACLIWEDGGPGDCEVHDLAAPFLIRV